MNDPHPPAFHGRCIAVTGASRGIGLAVARRLAAAGAHVLAGARNRSTDAPGGIEQVTLDVADEASVHACAERASALGADAVVCNAGVGSFAPIEQATVDEYRRIMDTNVLGTLLVARAFIPLFRARHARGLVSRFVCVTSDVSARTFAGGALYTASKHAQRALVQTLAHEGQACGLLVTEIRPGMTDTHFNGRTPGDPERAAHLQAADVAAAVAHVLAAPPHVRIDELVLHPAVQPVVYP